MQCYERSETKGEVNATGPSQDLAQPAVEDPYDPPPHPQARSSRDDATASDEAAQSLPEAPGQANNPVNRDLGLIKLLPP